MAAQSFFPTVQTVITRSLTDIGIVDPEGGITPTTAQLAGGLEILNFLLTSWQADGLQGWCVKELLSLPLVAGQVAYTIGNSTASPTPTWATGALGYEPREILQVWIRDSTNIPNMDLPLRKISREEYNLLSQKTSSGTPNQFNYEFAYSVPASNSGINAQGTVRVWPAPSAADVARYTVGMYYSRPLSDVSAQSDLLDLPQEWFNAVRWGLAKELMFGYNVPVMKQDRISAHAKDVKALALSYDRLTESVTIHPATRTNSA